MRQTLLAVTVPVLLVASFLGGCASSARPDAMEVWREAPPGATAPVGTVQRKDVVIAYYLSAAHAGHMARVQRERTDAISRGDATGAQAAEREARDLKTLAEDQLEGRARLTNIIRAVRASLDEIATETGVGMIVEAGAPQITAGTRTRDVSGAIVRRLPPAR